MHACTYIYWFRIRFGIILFVWTWNPVCTCQWRECYFSTGLAFLGGGPVGVRGRLWSSWGHSNGQSKYFKQRDFLGNIIISSCLFATANFNVGDLSQSVGLSVCVSLASDSSESIEVIMWFASDRLIHHMLIILTLIFIQGHTDLNQENNKG